MEEFNLLRLINSSPFIGNLSDKAVDALLDYYIETESTLKNINVDDMIVNSISILDKDDYEDNKDSYYLLCEDDGNYYVIN